MIIIFVMCLLLLATDIPTKIVIALIVFTSIILSMRDQLHGMISKFSGREVSDILKFAIISVVILPFLPNHNFNISEIPFLRDIVEKVFSEDILNWAIVINPFQIWMVVVFISSINFIGYFLNKILGNRKGLSITGFLGGFVSSTAVTHAMASQSKNFPNRNVKNLLINSTLLANLTSFVRIIAIAGFLNWNFGLKLIPPMIVMTIFLLVCVIFLMKKTAVDSKDGKDDDLKGLQLNFKSPFAIASALKLGGLFIGVSIFIKIAMNVLGDSGFVISSIISAISGLDAITLNTVAHVGKDVSTELGLLTLVMAASVNLVVKMVLIFIEGDKYFREKTNLIFLSTIFLGIATVIIELLL